MHSAIILFVKTPPMYLPAHMQYEIMHEWEARLSTDDVQRTRSESPPTPVQQHVHPDCLSTDAPLDPDEPSAAELADLAASMICDMAPPPPSLKQHALLPAAPLLV